MTAGLAVVGGFALVVGAWLYWWKDAPKITVLFFLIAGFAISGWFGGMLGQLLGVGLGMLQTTAASALGLAASGVAAGIAVVATFEVVVKGMGGKRAKPKRYHPWLALVLPSVIVATGLPILTTVADWFTRTVSSVTGSIV